MFAYYAICMCIESEYMYIACIYNMQEYMYVYVESLLLVCIACLQTETGHLPIALSHTLFNHTL